MDSLDNFTIEVQTLVDVLLRTNILMTAHHPLDQTPSQRPMSCTIPELLPRQRECMINVLLVETAMKIEAIKLGDQVNRITAM